ncbi:NaCP60E [Scenedesmus sp. PABB004]|nr:NaCP60E [Scenedesmus sp. PABB004]
MQRRGPPGVPDAAAQLPGQQAWAPDGARLPGLRLSGPGGGVGGAGTGMGAQQRPPSGAPPGPTTWDAVAAAAARRRSPSPTPPGGLSPALSQDLDGLDPGEAPLNGTSGGGEAELAGRHELYRAMRGSQADDPLTDPLLWDGDFLTSQREFITKKQEEAMLARLERRMGAARCAAAHAARASQGHGAGQLAARIAHACAPRGGAGRVKAAPVTPDASGAGGAEGAGGGAAPRAGSAAGGGAPVSPAGAGPSAGAKLMGLFGRRVSRASSVVVPLDAPGMPAGAAGVPRPASARPAPGGDGAAGGNGGAAGAGGGSVATPRMFTCVGLPSPRAPELGLLVADEAGSTPGSQPGAAVAAADAPADGTVEVITLAQRRVAAKAAEAKAREEAEALQRMDTAGRLQLEAAVAGHSWVRRAAIKVCTHPDFELAVLLLIAGNCVSLAAYDPLRPHGARDVLLGHIAPRTGAAAADRPPPPRVRARDRPADLGLNVAFTVEMVLRILSMGGLFAYLRHPWNAFDCVMVLAGYTTFIPAAGAGLEGVKALRALRALRPLRTITRFAALRSIVVCFLEAVPLLLFGDAFHRGCVDAATGAREADAASVADEFGCGHRTCPPAFSTCFTFPTSQAREMAGFANVGLSMLSVFQSMTLTNWSFTMYRTMDALNPGVVVYWFVMIVFGSYFVLNLFLAVLKSKFAKAKSLLDEKRRHRRALKGERGARKRGNVLARASGWVSGRVSAFVSARAGRDSLASHISDVVSRKTGSEGDLGSTRTALTGFTEAVDAPPPSSGGGAAQGRPPPPPDRQLSRSESLGSGMSGTSGYTGVTGVTGVSGASGASHACLLSIGEFDESVAGLPWAKRAAMRAQYRLRVVVCSGWFSNTFVAAILLNTLVLALTHEGMSHEFEAALNTANSSFTYIFAFEMVAKMAGLGPWAYLTDVWNLFDALVVAFSLVELITELMATSSASGLTALRSVRSLRVIRSFRVLRVMKMFKYLDSLKMIASVLISSLGSFASIVVLLVLFWLVFAIMGLHVFGGLHLDEPWPNADTLVDSLILNFNTLNLENFQTTMYSVIRATNYGSAAYWLAWVILGKYIFLTLFLAVTLDAFERKYEVDLKRGVRSQSVASSVFGRIKRASARIRGAATSVAGSASGRSGLLGGLFGGRGGGGDARAAHRATGEDAPTMVVSLAPGEAASRRTTADAERRRTTGERRAPGRRASVDGRREPAAQQGGRGRGPLGESVHSPEAPPLSGWDGWGWGLRQRRHRLGLEAACGGAGGAKARRLSGDCAAAAAGGKADGWPGPGAAWLGQRRSSSGNCSASSSGGSSFTLQREAAAAFAAAAAADALLPQHAFSELVDSAASSEDEAARRGGADPPHGYGRALADALRLTGGREADGRAGGAAAWGELPFSWTEFLGTVAAIDHPLAVRAQRLARQQALAAQAGGGGAPAATLGPIAEATEALASPTATGLRRAAGCSLELEGAGTATLSRGLGVAAAAAAAAAGGAPAAGGGDGGGGGAGLVPRPPLGPRPAPAARAARAQQPLSVAALESELRGLGLPPQGGAAEPQTPSLVVSGGTPALHGVSWPGLFDAELEGLGPAREPPAADAVRAAPGLGGEPATEPSPRGALHGLSPRLRGGAGPPKRVTLLTESMRHRGEGPAVPAAPGEPPGSPRHIYNPGALAAHPAGCLKGGAPAASDLDDLIDLPPPAAWPGAGPASAAPEPLARAASGFDAPALEPLELGAPLEPSITTSAIRRREAAAAATAALAAGEGAGAASLGSELPGGVGDPGGAASGRHGSRGQRTARVPALPRQSDAASGVESSAPSATSGGGGAGGRRLSRSASMGSDGGLSAGSGGTGSQSGAWSVGSRSRRSRTFPELTGRSLWLFGETNALRCAVYDLVTSRGFDYVMFALIIANCGAMAYEHPHMSREHLDGRTLFWSDVVFTAAFAAEAALKVFAFGLRPYLGYVQNQVDAVIVLTSLAFIFLDSLNLEIVKALRVLRAVKPLRALTRSAGMQLIFKSLTLRRGRAGWCPAPRASRHRVLQHAAARRLARRLARRFTRRLTRRPTRRHPPRSVAAMGNVSIVVALFFLIFAILGVQLFHGMFYSCNDASVAGQAECVGSFVDDAGQEVARRWSNQPYNFDNLGMAMVSLFVTATLNGYTEIMSAAMAVPTERGLQPRPMSSWPNFFFFAAFVLVVAYTLLNLYIGVVFYQFSRIRLQSQTGSAFLTDDQTEWVELSRLVFRLKPPEKSPVPVNRFRKRLYHLVQSKRFEVALMALIVANSALMATTHHGQPPAMVAAVEALNYAFTCAYVLEFGLKLGGLGWEGYWKSGWNRFDAALLAVSVVDMAVALALGSEASFLKVQKIMRLLRLARVVKLMRGMKGLRSLFGTLIASLPAFWNVGALLALLFFMYAYVGMLLLGSVRRNGGLNEHANFERFWTAALTLFKVATNDNWTDVMLAAMVHPPECDASAGECGSWVVYPYFLSFVLLVSIIMLNLFTAVILESFEAQQEQDRWKLRPEHLDEFVELWAEYDDGSGTIDPRDLEGMLLRLSPPLGLGPGASSSDVLRFVFDLDIPLLGGRVPFQRTAYELVRRCSGAEIPEGILKDQIDRLVFRAFRGLKADEVLNFSVAVTVMRVQRKWRARMRAAKLKRKREFRAERGVAPEYADVVAGRDAVMKAALLRRQAGDLRWRPHAAYGPQWAAAEAALAAEQAAAAAAAAAALSRSGILRRSDAGGGDEGSAPFRALANVRATADGWVARVADGLTRLKARRLFSSTGAEGGLSARWGWGGSRAGSKAASEAASRAASEAASRAVSETASRTASEAAGGMGRGA